MYIGMVTSNFGHDLILKDVLLVPGFKFNLISASSLTLNPSIVVYFPHSGDKIQDTKANKMIGKGDRMHNMYVLEEDSWNSVDNLTSGTTY